MNCSGCGSALLTMTAQSRGLCMPCDNRLRAEASLRKHEEPDLGELESSQLVNELLKRGWTASERTVLLAPADTEGRHHGIPPRPR